MAVLPQPRYNWYLELFLNRGSECFDIIPKNLEDKELLLRQFRDTSVE